MTPIPKDRLFLLKPDFSDAGFRQFCSECAMVEGMLSFYPSIRKALDIKYINFTRPRKEIVSALGPDHQSSPLLIVGDAANAKRAGPNVKIQAHGGKQFVNDPFMVCEYLASVHGVGRPRK
ncbi:MAG TPA: DUF3088 family protein [Candidatus Thermoplasmatota archaeon]|nr:DUF3088 family protein [Candidatus Thermoplasmatota archaeon]